VFSAVVERGKLGEAKCDLVQTVDESNKQTNKKKQTNADKNITRLAEVMNEITSWRCCNKHKTVK